MNPAILHSLLHVLGHVEVGVVRVDELQLLRHGQQRVVELDQTLEVRQLVRVRLVEAHQEEQQLAHVPLLHEHHLERRRVTNKTYCER